jgi:cytoskeletal protein RodZ
MVRVAVAAGTALLAAWLIALALGVLGGFESLPGLPSSQSGGSHETSARTHGTSKPVPVVPQSAAPVKTVAPSAVPNTSSSTQSQSSNPKTSVSPASPQPTTSPTSTTATHGQSAAKTTQTTGKPVGSPGNAAGGSGAPGQLR